MPAVAPSSSTTCCACESLRAARRSSFGKRPPRATSRSATCVHSGARSKKCSSTPWSKRNADLRSRLSTLVRPSHRTRLALARRNAPRRENRARRPLDSDLPRHRLGAGPRARVSALPLGAARAPIRAHLFHPSAVSISRQAHPCRPARIPRGNLDRLLQLFPAHGAAILDGPYPARGNKSHQPGPALQRATTVLLPPAPPNRLLLREAWHHCR